MLIFATCKFNLKCIIMAKKDEFVEICGGDKPFVLDEANLPADKDMTDKN